MKRPPKVIREIVVRLPLAQLPPYSIPLAIGYFFHLISLIIIVPLEEGNLPFQDLRGEMLDR